MNALANQSFSLKFLALCIFSLALVFPCIANASSVRASFDIPYEAGIFSSEPSVEFKSKALDRGRLEIWRAYQTKLDSTKIGDIERNKAAIEARLGEIVTNVSIIDQQVMKDSRIVKYTVRGTVNTTLVDTLLQAAGGGATASGGGSLFGFLFVPRMQSETKELDSTVTKVVKATAAKSRGSVASDQVKEVDGGVEERTIEGAEVKTGAKVTTSGSATRRAAQSSWTAVEAKGVDAEVNKVLTESGFESSSFNDILAECGEGSADGLIDDLVNSKTMNFTRNNLKAVSAALKECKVRFFGVGYLDIDSIQRDEQTGGWLVRVAVNVNVRDYGAVHSGERRVAATVATVQESSSGIGRTQEAARDSALQAAGRQAATIVASQLRAKGLR
ncbi:MAG: hypothetical protein ACO3FP_09255 [Burkholderiales bacterium]